MKQIAVAMLLALGLTLSACGGGTTSANVINGNWTATLTNPNGAPTFAFTTSLSQNSGSSSVNVTNLSFTTATACFSSPTSQTGSFVLAGNFNGDVTGAFAMTVSTMFSTAQNNVLTLQGSENNNTISGTWTLTGVQSGCTGSGNFTIIKM